MCQVTASKTTPSSPTNKPSLRLLVSLDSFDDDNNKGTPPSLASCVVTGLVVLLFLCSTERLFLYIFESLQHVHPLLEIPVNCQILARHVGVDALSCGIVSCLGWSSYKLHKGLWQHVFGRGKGKGGGGMPLAAYDQRLFTYHPSGFRVALFFFCYQIKNLYDTLWWNDGPEFVFHHVFSLLTAWGSMTPGCGHIYCIFFFGMCEISTGILCLLANFDDEQGVPGLGHALPHVKVGLGTLFVVTFIICRCVLWPIYSYYFSRDVIMALKQQSSSSSSDDTTTSSSIRNIILQRQSWMKFFLVSLTGLSVLQIAWLGQIFVIAKQELTQIGLL